MKTTGFHPSTSLPDCHLQPNHSCNETRIGLSKGLLLLLLTLGLAACNNEIKQASGTISSAASSFELLDPTPGTGDRFGQFVAILANGNIVVSDVFDSSIGGGNGAVHLYNPATQSIIASIYGDATNDNLGSGGIFPLANGNFVIVSPLDGGPNNFGSVMLVNGATGAVIGAPITGDDAGDQLGSGGGIIELANGNFVISTPLETNGAVPVAGTARLISGVTGLQVGTTFAGNSIFDTLGLGGIVALGNGNFVINSPADAGAVGTGGSIMLVDGSSGAQIGATFAGDTAADQLGLGGVVALANNNFVIASPFDDEGVVDGGTIMLVNGATGAQIGVTLEGDVANDRLGFSVIGGVKALANSNFVVSSSLDDEAFVDGGSIRLVDGATGVQIGATIAGESASEQLELVTVHANNTFVAASPFYDNGATTDVGSIRLFSGTTGLQIGATTTGDVASDQLGLGSVIQLTNSNYAIASIQDDDGGVVDAGSIMLWDGANGNPLGAAIVGDIASDQLGFGNIIALANDNFAVASIMDDDGATVDAGSVRLVNGNSGAQIAAIVGDVANDMLGSGNIVALANGNFVILSDVDNEGGNADVGSVRLINGATGAQVGSTFVGTVADDLMGAVVAPAATGGDYVLGLGMADKGGLVNSGQAFLFTD